MVVLGSTVNVKTRQISRCKLIKQENGVRVIDERERERETKQQPSKLFLQRDKDGERIYCIFVQYL